MSGSPDTDDERLRALLRDAVSDVEPRDGLGEVRRRTRLRRTPSRRWAPILVGAGAVVATVVVASVVVSGLGDQPGRSSRPPVAGTSQAGPTTAAAGLYFVSDTATGPRLFREFQAIGIAADPEQRILLALQRLTADSGPRDPDYRTSWPADSFVAVRLETDRIVVALGSPALRSGDPALGRLGVQQAVYTAEAALGETLPVSFERDGQPVRRVLGLEVDSLVERDRSFAITAPVNITDPAEQLAVEDGVLRARGTMAAYVEDVAWSLTPAGGGTAVREGTAEPVDLTGSDAGATLGAPGWQTGEIDLAGLAPGDYVFAVTVTDVGQTSDRPAEFGDTRTISVR